MVLLARADMLPASKRIAHIISLIVIGSWTCSGQPTSLPEGWPWVNTTDGTPLANLAAACPPNMSGAPPGLVSTILSETRPILSVGMAASLTGRYARADPVRGLTRGLATIAAAINGAHQDMAIYFCVVDDMSNLTRMVEIYDYLAFNTISVDPALLASDPFGLLGLSRRMQSEEYPYRLQYFVGPSYVPFRSAAAAKINSAGGILFLWSFDSNYYSISYTGDEAPQSSLDGDGTRVATSEESHMLSNITQVAEGADGDGPFWDLDLDNMIDISIPRTRLPGQALDLLMSKGAQSISFVSTGGFYEQAPCVAASDLATRLGYNATPIWTVRPGALSNATDKWFVTPPDVLVMCVGVNLILDLLLAIKGLNIEIGAIVLAEPHGLDLASRLESYLVSYLIESMPWSLPLDFDDHSLPPYMKILGLRDLYLANFLDEKQLNPAAAQAMALGQLLELGSRGAVINTTDPRTPTTVAEYLRSDTSGFQTIWGRLRFNPQGKRVPAPNDYFEDVGVRQLFPLAATQSENVTYMLQRYFSTKINLVRESSSSGLLESSPEVTFPQPSVKVKQLEVYACKAGCYLNSTVCVPCPPGHFRSVDDLYCRPCPAGSYSNQYGLERCKPCESGNSCLAPNATNPSLPGFYRIDKFKVETFGPFKGMAETYVVPGESTLESLRELEGTFLDICTSDALAEERFGYYACTPEDICLGDNRCYSGNTGALCGQCEAKFSFFGIYSAGRKCRNCPAYPFVAMATLAAGIFWLLSLIFFIYIMDVLSSRRNSVLLGSARIVLVHLAQLAAIADATKLDAHASLYSIFPGTLTNLMFYFVTLLPVDCYFRSSGRSKVEVFEGLFNFVMLFPVGGLAAIMVVFCLAVGGNWMKHRLRHTKEPENNFIMHRLLLCGHSCILWLIITYPPAVAMAVRFHSCQKLDVRRLRLHLDVECDDAKSQSLINNSGIFSWVWGIALPVTFFLSQLANISRFQELWYRRLAGFTFIGYQAAMWWWGPFVALKLGLLFLNSASEKDDQRYSTCVLLIAVYIFIQLLVSPNDPHNQFLQRKLDLASSAGLLVAAGAGAALRSGGGLEDYKVFASNIVALVNTLFLLFAVVMVVYAEVAIPLKIRLDAGLRISRRLRWILRLGQACFGMNNMIPPDVKSGDGSLDMTNLTESEREFMRFSMEELLRAIIDSSQNFSPSLVSKGVFMAFSRGLEARSSKLRYWEHKGWFDLDRSILLPERELDENAERLASRRASSGRRQPARLMASRVPSGWNSDYIPGVTVDELYDGAEALVDDIVDRHPDLLQPTHEAEAPEADEKQGGQSPSSSPHAAVEEDGRSGQGAEPTFQHDQDVVAHAVQVLQKRDADSKQSRDYVGLKRKVKERAAEVEMLRGRLQDQRFRNIRTFHAQAAAAEAHALENGISQEVPPETAISALRNEAAVPDEQQPPDLPAEQEAPDEQQDGSTGSLGLLRLLSTMGPPVETDAQYLHSSWAPEHHKHPSHRLSPRARALDADEERLADLNPPRSAWVEKDQADDQNAKQLKLKAFTAAHREAAVLPQLGPAAPAVVGPLELRFDGDAAAMHVGMFKSMVGAGLRKLGASEDSMREVQVVASNRLPDGTRGIRATLDGPSAALEKLWNLDLSALEPVGCPILSASDAGGTPIVFRSPQMATEPRSPQATPGLKVQASDSQNGRRNRWV